MDWKFYSSFDDIPARQVYQMLKLRQDVFVIEQKCIYEDIDKADFYSAHLFLQKEDSLAGYARIVPAGKKYREISIGRIVIAPAMRGKQLGSRLVRKSLEIIKDQGENRVRIEAQSHLIPFYNRLGFKTEGEEYILDGISHIEMVIYDLQS